MKKTKDARPETLSAGSGWCPGCHDAGRIQDGHFLCSRPPPGYEPGALEDGGWTAVLVDSGVAPETFTVREPGHAAWEQGLTSRRAAKQSLREAIDRGLTSAIIVRD